MRKEKKKANYLVTSEKGSYTIHNAEWNQDIPLDGRVSFGMIIKSDKKPVFPKYCNTTRICLGVMTEYKVEYTEYSSWNNHINGKITITNCGNNRIEDWKLMLETFGMQLFLLRKRKKVYTIMTLTM